ncbi:MAG TPA: hypothetical protein VF420_13260 [Casimicrobiaceae bacterium]
MILEPYARVPGYPLKVPPFFVVSGPGGPVFASLTEYPADQVARAVRANGGQAWVSPVLAPPWGLQWPSWARQGVGATLPTGQSFFWGFTSSELGRYIAGVLADRTAYRGQRIRLDSFARAMGFYT